MMMKKQYLLIISFVLLIFSLGCGILGGAANSRPTAQVRIIPPTHTPMPTFTPTAPLSVAVIIPTATDTPVPPPPQAQQPTQPTATPLPPTNTPVPAPQVSITGATVNVRSGPGTAYPRVGQVSNGYTTAILGRNNDASWVFINYPGGQGWIYSNLAQLQGDVNSVPVPQIAPPPATPTPPPPPPPTATPVPQAQYQYTVSNVFAKTNKGLTQIKGIIRDAAGNPVNGVYVRVRSGSFCTISFKSGPWKDANGNPSGYQPGEYDIMLWPGGERVGTWSVDIVPERTQNDTDACRNMQPLSETKEIQTAVDASIVHVEWKKNW